MGEFVYHPAEGAYVLSRAEWYLVRAAYYRDARIPRDDAQLPLVFPLEKDAQGRARRAWARRVTALANARSWVDAPEYVFAAPESDIPIDLSELVVAEEPPGTLEPLPPPRFDPRTLARLPDPPRKMIPDPARCVAVVAEPDYAALPAPAVLAKGQIGPHARLYPAEPEARLVGVYVVSARDVGLPHGRWLVRADGGPIVADTSWISTPWAQSPTVIFLPPSVVGGAGPSRADTVQLGAEDAVLVPRPHPFLPDSVIERIVLEPATTAAPPGTARRGVGVTTLTRVRSTAVATASGSSSGAKRLDAGWIGSHEKSDPSIARRVGAEIARIDNNVARIASAVVGTITGTVRAVASGDVSIDAIGAAVLVTALTGPAGLTLLQSKSPWRDAVRVGALHYALAYSPLVKLSERYAAQGMAVERAGGGPVAQSAAGQPLRPGLQDLSEPRYAVPGLGSPVSASDIEAAEVVATKALLLDRDGAQAFLVRVIEQGGFVDLVLTRLVIEAEADAAKRKEMLARFTAKQAEWWDKYGQHIARAVGLILDVVAPGTGSLLFSIAKMLYEAAIMVQQLEVNANAQRAAERRDREELARIDAEIAAIEAELARAGSSILTGATTTPSPSPGWRAPVVASDPWYAPWVRLAVREWVTPPPPPRPGAGPGSPPEGPRGPG